MSWHGLAHWIAAQASASPSPTSVSPFPSPSLDLHQPTTFEDDMKDLRAAAAASLQDTLEAAHRHSLCQKELELVIQASRTSSVLPMDLETSTESGSGAAASGSGVGSEECTQEEIQLLQAHDSNLTLDSRGKAINKPVRQCDK
jgi:hypothetical protein